VFFRFQRICQQNDEQARAAGQAVREKGKDKLKKK